MNRAAEQHLEAARGFLGRGDEFYAKAADEIIAARAADTTLGYREIAATFDRSEKWARMLVTWRTSAEATAAPFYERPLASGDRATNASAKHRPEVIVEAIRQAPPEQRRQILRGVVRDPVTQNDVRSEVAQDRWEEEKAIERKTRERSPGLHQWGDFLEFQGHLIKAAMELKAGLKGIREVEFTDEEREVVAEWLDQIEMQAGWMRSYMKSGDSSWDEALARLTTLEG